MWACEHRENPQRLALPQMQDAEAASIGLKRLPRKGSNRFDFSGKGSSGQAEDVVDHALPFGDWNVVEIALGATHQPHVLRYVACHAGSPST